MSTSGKSNLTGIFRHNLDDKNRVTVPSVWRNLFEKEDTFLAIPNPDGYVTVLPPIEAEKLHDKFSAVPLHDTDGQDAITAFMAKAQAFKFDKQGRIALSDSLFAHVGLSGPKEEVILVGSATKFNLYNPEDWAEREAKNTSATVANVMKRFAI